MRLIYLLSGLIYLSACGVSGSHTDKKLNKQNNDILVETTSEEIEIGSRLGDDVQVLPKLYHATRTQLTSLVHTKLNVEFDWNKSWMIGQADLTLKPYFYASDSLFLDAKGMEIKKITINGKDLTYKYNGEEIRIQLDKKYTRTETYNLVIDYIAKPDERLVSGGKAITSDKGLYFINPKGEDPNKMPQIWTQGETESNSVWFPTVDSPNMKSTQEIFITVDQKYTTLSNGKRLSSTINKNGTRTDHWKQEIPHAVYLFMMGVGEFKVVQDSYTRKDGSKMEVNYYVEPAWEQHARAIFGETPAMIRFFSDLTGIEYPWDKYNQIVVREFVSGAMENTGAVVFGDFVYKSRRELLDENDQATIAHELFHHWFGNIVTAESWSNLALNEAFANYSQYLWDEHRYGIDEADYNASAEKDKYFESVLKKKPHDLIWYDYTDKDDMFDSHSYSKGGRILHMLRNYLGDEAFFAGMKHYLQTYQYKAAEFHQLRTSFEAVCGEDLNWFFNQWFLGKGTPELTIKQTISADKKEVVLAINQIQNLNESPLYKLPVEVAVFDSKGKHIYPIVIDKRLNSFSFPIEGELKTVIFDHQHALLAKYYHDKPAEQYREQFYLGKRYEDRRLALLYSLDSLTSKGEQLILDALKDPFWEVRLDAISSLKRSSAETTLKADGIIREIAYHDPHSSNRITALDQLVPSLSEMEAKEMIVKILDSDSSYQVTRYALVILSQLDPDLAKQMIKKMEADPTSAMKVIIAEYYEYFGTESDLEFFKNLFDKNQLVGQDIIYGTKSLAGYFIEQNPEIQVQLIPYFRNIHAKGGVYGKMYLPYYVAFLIENIETQLTETNELLAANKKNKNEQHVVELKGLKAKQESILDQLKTLKIEVGELKE
ncbi:MAG: M1 family metallopeptidase [Crocinitomicaceae bacterium]|nr:M1 family metallopeptidase [Crocinitomicaceae bacterium]